MNETYLAIVSGRHGGALGALARGGLAALALAYRAGLAARNLRFAVRPPYRPPVPVLSIGNLTVGGTGKTPMVALAARLALEMGARPLIASRGYGAAGAGRPNEEALELARLVPGVPHVQDPDRSRAIREFIEKGVCDLVILDDGFQHRRVARDLDVVLIDALRPFGYGRLLPRGLLREPPSALGRADMAVITRADLAGPDAVDAVRAELVRRLPAGAPILTAAHRPTALVTGDGERRPVEGLRDAPVAAACGIGNPEAFRRTLEAAGARLVLWRTFPDHHRYAPDDLVRLTAGAKASGAKMLVTTLKDYVKWRALPAGAGEPQIPAAALEIALELTEGHEALRDRFERLLAPGGAEGTGGGR